MEDQYLTAQNISLNKFNGKKIKQQLEVLKGQDYNVVFKNSYWNTLSQIYFLNMEFDSLYIKAHDSNYFVIDLNNPSLKQFYNIVSQFSYFYINQTYNVNFNSVYMPNVLVDSDYPKDKIIFSFFNTRDEPVILNSWIAQVQGVSIFNHGNTSLYSLYPTPIFNYVNISDNIEYDTIKNFWINTPGANAVDIIFNNQYIIYAKGILDLYLPINRGYHSRPNSLLLRSRYARVGIQLLLNSIDSHTLKVTLVNNSPNNIDLGHRFLSFSPESLIAANLYHEYIPPIGIFKHNCYDMYIPVVYGNEIRKIKAAPKVSYI